MRRGNGRSSSGELPVSASSFFFLSLLFLPSFPLYRIPILRISSSSPRCSLRTTRVFIPSGLFAMPCRIRGDCNFNSGGILPLAPHRRSKASIPCMCMVRTCACVHVWIYGSCITPANSSSNTSSTSFFLLDPTPGRIPILILRCAYILPDKRSLRTTIAILILTPGLFFTRPIDRAIAPRYRSPS